MPACPVHALSAILSDWDCTNLSSRARLIAPMLFILMGAVPSISLGNNLVRSGVPSLEARIVALTNVERMQRGLAPLRLDDSLVHEARDHSEEMIRLDYFAHESPTEGLHTVSDRAALAGCTDIEVGENIAYYRGYSLEAAARRVVSDWMNSPGHRANILRPTYTSIGIGIAFDRNKVMVSQEFSGHHICVDHMRERTCGNVLKVYVSGHVQHLTSEVCVFEDTRRRSNTELAHAFVSRNGRFTVAVTLRSNSGTHQLRIGTLACAGERGSEFDIYTRIPIDTDGVAVR